jgi:transposase
MDTSKSVFQLHGVDEAEQPVLRKKLRRNQVLAFFAGLSPLKIGMEVCGAAHYWARELRALGHGVVLLPPQYVKPYVKRSKSDAADAGAICEAMSRPEMRSLPSRVPTSRDRKCWRSCERSSSAGARSSPIRSEALRRSSA